MPAGCRDAAPLLCDATWDRKARAQLARAGKDVRPVERLPHLPLQVCTRGGATPASWDARPPGLLGQDAGELQRARGRGIGLNLKAAAGAWEQAGLLPPSLGLPHPAPGREEDASCEVQQGWGRAEKAALSG